LAHNELNVDLHTSVSKLEDTARNCLLLRSSAILIPVLLASLIASALAAFASDASLQADFKQTIHPFLETYCFGCHGKEKQKGKLDLSPYTDAQTVAHDFRRWQTVLEKLKAEEMPPEEAKKQPAPELRARVSEWIQQLRRNEAERNAGDPGVVLARRLSNAEYDYTIRDLTGVDIRPAREFPVDPANEAGFDNSGESLMMSPALLKKYLEAARHVTEHILFQPNGLAFAPYPVVTDTDRDKYCVQQIISFYQDHSTNYADYFLSAWRFKHRAGSGKLSQFATSEKVSGKYLETIWQALEERSEDTGPIKELQAMWQEISALDASQEQKASDGCQRMREFIQTLRQQLKPEVKNLSIRGIAAGSQPFVLWKDQEMALNHRRYNRQALKLQSDSEEGIAPLTNAVERALLIPPDKTAAERYERELEHFCRIFPDAFYVPERGLVFLKEDKESKGRLLSAGFHLMTGYFRDDAPLYDLMLDADEQRELDRLWRDFDFVTRAPIRQYKDFIFFERAEPPRYMQGAEFDFARSEDNDVTSGAKINQLAEAYLTKARRNGGEGAAIRAIENYFKSTSDRIRLIETNHLAAEQWHLESLLNFAERAYRRPLSQSERDDLLAFYRQLRATDGLNHEDALRDTVASVVMSPAFLYRVPETARGQGIRAISDYALANRLSYFLWSSLPDKELLSHAAAGDLHRPEVLIRQARRMLDDDRSRALAVEFGGNWLDFRRFEEHNSVDRERFKSFNNELREAMFEEPIRFFENIMRDDRSVLDFIYGDYTFVNSPLAEHYGMPAPGATSNQWVRVDHATEYGRGGLLPMAVFLTRNSPGLRTSPVKRGYWVVRRLLGEYIAPPPAKVPELPSDETKLGNFTLREMLERHRADKTCAACHAHFDSLGLVFEGYGPVGERRTEDLAGHPIELRAALPGGAEASGVEGLRQYLRDHRENDFVDNLCRKLLAYALGRTVILSDDPTIETMRTRLAQNGYRFSTLIDAIVTSRQFLNARGQADLARN
jgi:cytochrome c553